MKDDNIVFTCFSCIQGTETLCSRKPKPCEETTFRDSRQHPSVDVQEDNYIKARIGRWGTDGWGELYMAYTTAVPFLELLKGLEMKMAILSPAKVKICKEE